MRVLGLDIETTGISGEKDKPNNSDLLEIGLVFYDTDYAFKNRVSYKQLDEQEVSKYRIIVYRPTKYLQGGLVAFEMHKDTLIPLHKRLDNCKVEDSSVIMELQSKELSNSNVMLCRPDNILETIMSCLRNEGWISADNFGAFKNNGTGVKEAITCAGKNVGTFDIKYLSEYIKNFGKTIKPRARVFDPTVMFFDYRVDEALPDLQTCIDRARDWDSSFPRNGAVKHTAVEDAMEVINLIHCLGLNGLFPIQLMEKIKPILDSGNYASVKEWVIKLEDIYNYFIKGSGFSLILDIIKTGRTDYTFCDKIPDELKPLIADFLTTESARDYIGRKIVEVYNLTCDSCEE